MMYIVFMVQIWGRKVDSQKKMEASNFFAFFAMQNFCIFFE